VRAAPPWYAHHVVRQGYTHEGQVIGAGIGPGSDMQRLAAAWRASSWSAGGRVERLRIDSDGFYRFYSPQGPDFGNYRRHDVLLALGAEGRRTFDWGELRLDIVRGVERNRYTALGNDVGLFHARLRAEISP
jgi:hypothetical protein